MTFAQRNAIVNPAAGLLIYCTDFVDGEMQYYNGSNWMQMTVSLGSVPPVVPTITTTKVGSTSPFTARTGGNITNNGGALVSARGVCWSTSSNPTIALTTKTSDSIGSGVFVSNITGLLPYITYHARAYATNSVGTAYGGDSAFMTNPVPSVMICSQVWMIKNLDISTYRNGDPIPQVTDATQWSGLTTGAWCWYNNDSATYASYGKLYNWYAVNDPRGLAPSGWHVPSYTEWTTLSTCLGGDAVAGGALKEAGTTHWLSPNTGATNSSGFAGLPASFRIKTGTYNAIGVGSYGYWWSSTESVGNSLNAWFWNLAFDNTTVSSNTPNKASGLSVRCLRD
jgi:uncharacterized protein (TIGR02145 family)